MNRPLVAIDQLREVPVAGSSRSTARRSVGGRPFSRRAIGIPTILAPGGPRCVVSRAFPRYNDRPALRGRRDMTRQLRERHLQYLESEVPLTSVSRAGRFRVALCYPNLYTVGMSNLGFHSIYKMLNAMPEVTCDRVFLPDDVDAAALERAGQSLTAV